MSWILNEEARWQSDRLRVNMWDLHELRQTLTDKSLRYDGKDYSGKLKPEEELLLHAVNNLINSYDRKDHYVRERNRKDKEEDINRQLSQQLLDVTEERDSLLEKIKEAQIQSGLFIKYVKEKLNL